METVLTERALIEAMESIQPAALSTHPTRLVVSPHGEAVFLMFQRSAIENWNWRRLKRELRRAETSIYRRPGF